MGKQEEKAQERAQVDNLHYEGYYDKRERQYYSGLVMSLISLGVSIIILILTFLH